MKRSIVSLLTIVLLFSLPFQLMAVIRTVSNNPANVAQFNTIQAAIDASAAGDTVYVHGSPTVYANFNVNKRLVIMGPGWTPNKQIPLRATVQSIMFQTGSDNSELHGMDVANNIDCAGGVNNLRFFRNYIGVTLNVNNSNVTYTGYVFQGNYIDGGISGGFGSQYNNFLIENNVFRRNDWSFSAIQFANNFLVNHNLFFNSSPSGTAPVFINGCRQITLTNNIFVRRSAGTQLSLAVFNNNLTYAPGATDAATIAPWTINNNQDGGSNIVNQNPQMANQAAVDAGTAVVGDYTIASGFANNAGTDLKDLGLLFDETGPLNWNNSRTSRLPLISSLNVKTPTVPAGGNLTIEVQARRNN